MTTNGSTPDFLAIAELYEEYGKAFDEGRAADYAALFTADGTFNLPDGHSVVGTERLRRLAQRSAEGNARPHHFVRNLTLDIHQDRAEGTAHAIAVAVTGTEVSLLVAGVYRDTMVKTPRGWKFESRTVTELAPDTLPALGSV